jgi:hypothetical protein
MKKFLAYFTTVLFVGVISLSVLAFSDKDPKKQKKETATTEQCDKMKEATATKDEAKPCCKKSTDSTATACPKAAECKHHKETTPEVK